MTNGTATRGDFNSKRDILAILVIAVSENAVVNEFTRHLRTQLGFLEKSAASYDAGETDEALRMAVALRVMFYDTPNSTSLMQHIGIRQTVSLLDTAGPMDPHNLAAMHPLTLIRVDPKARRADHVPVLGMDPPDRTSRLIPFEDWWTMPVIRDLQREFFSRKELVTFLAHKEGGAHFDPNFTPGHKKLAKQNSIGWRFISGDTATPMESPIPASVRQITHEVLTTFREHQYAVVGWPAPDVQDEFSGEWVRVGFVIDNREPVTATVVAAASRYVVRNLEPVVHSFYRLDESVLDTGIRASDTLMARGRRRLLEWIRSLEPEDVVPIPLAGGAGVIETPARAIKDVTADRYVA